MRENGPSHAEYQAEAIQHLREMHKEGILAEEMKRKWSATFVEQGVSQGRPEQVDAALYREVI